MAQRVRLTKGEVEDLLSDHQRSKLVELYHLGQILENAIISADYRPSDELRNSIGLTPYGHWLLQQSKKFEFATREGRLACLLELYHLDLLVDIDTTDLSALATSITKEIKEGRLKFPMIFGPGLYLKAADLFPDERRSLNAVDTQRLIDGQSVGVFQRGRWLGGPWGLYEHEVKRNIGPSHMVPLQHCHDVSCWIVHKVWLNSDSSAEIIKARPQIRKALESEGEEPSDFAAVLAQTLRDPAADFDADSLGAMAFLVGDGLGDDELKTLTQHLLDGRTAKVFRSRVLNLSGRTGAAHDIVDGLDRAELLQLVLLADDTEIATALDELVYGSAAHGRRISIPAHEIRSSVLTRAAASNFSSRPEYSRLGVRTRSKSAAAPLKLRRLIDWIYFTGVADAGRVQDLEWQLRSVPGVSIESRLTEFLRKTPPYTVLRQLVLNTRDNVLRGSEALGLEANETVSDDDLVDRMLWKLGFDVAGSDQLHDDFWRHNDRLRKAVEAASVSTSVGEEEIGEISASYFRALEKLLGDTLVFCTWALTTDHVREDDPYLYAENANVLAHTTNQLGPGLAARGDISDSKVGVEQWTLQPLCRGFEVLSELLRTYEKHDDAHLRSASSVPDFADQTMIQRFPFKHNVPFLDLTIPSRQRLHLVLADATKSLLRSRAAEIRNGLVHYRRSNVDLASLVESLQIVEGVVRNLEAQGLVRIVFRRQRVETDRWGRALHTLVDSAGTERVISRPSAYAWINLPQLQRPQYLMTAAQFDQMGEYLRFRPGADSEYRQLWAGVPARRLQSVVSGSKSDDGVSPSAQQ